MTVVTNANKNAILINQLKPYVNIIRQQKHTKVIN